MHHRELRYYLRNPPPENATGDVWKNVPCNGICKQALGTAVVISPACDLANCKTEVITLVPIVSILHYYSSIASYMEYRSTLNAQLKSAGLDRFTDYVGIESLPRPQDITTIQDLIASRGITDNAVKQRIVTTLNCLNRSLSPELQLNTWSDLRRAFGKKFDDELRAIITNSKRSDLHFLPRDGEDHEWSAIPLHAVALLRYPITLPINSIMQTPTLRATAPHLHGQPTSAIIPPTKVLRIQPPFTSDLISRFASLFSRLGSPDFTESDVERIITEITQ